MDLALPVFLVAMGLVVALRPHALSQAFAFARRRVVGRSMSTTMRVGMDAGVFRLAGLMTMVWGVVMVAVQAPMF